MQIAVQRSVLQFALCLCVRRNAVVLTQPCEGAGISSKNFFQSNAPQLAGMDGLSRLHGFQPFSIKAVCGFNQYLAHGADGVFALLAQVAFGLQ